MDGMGGNGLKIENNRPIFSSFDATCSKNPEEIYYGRLAFSAKIHLISLS